MWVGLEFPVITPRFCWLFSILMSSSTLGNVGESLLFKDSSVVENRNSPADRSSPPHLFFLRSVFLDLNPSRSLLEELSPFLSGKKVRVFHSRSRYGPRRRNSPFFQTVPKVCPRELLRGEISRTTLLFGDSLISLPDAGSLSSLSGDAFGFVIASPFPGRVSLFFLFFWPRL